jgi:hypothetical protein
MPSSGS